MFGLLSIALVVAWFFAARWIARKLTGSMSSRLKRTSLTWLAVAVIFVLPVIDEIIGGFQFRALCKEHAVLKVNAEKIKGKTVRVVVDPSNKDVDNTAVRIYYTHLSYRDVETGEELANTRWYTATAGVLIRILTGNSGSTLTIHPSTCSAGLSKSYGFTLIN